MTIAIHCECGLASEFDIDPEDTRPNQFTCDCKRIYMFEVYIVDGPVCEESKTAR